ncbi:altronate hydrolase [Algoriphagus ratkowskyi]|uniref:Altronate dehydratase n=1 Tax=Algoriphagus ratkowskyi TaxID=57028 RepID=A0A2W7QWV9_9BACT|nr:UxaA family hydrolase [Algoriphagus ratkowskyi]PZX53063.1 altronate hydrolase [Algoriphagus ratkowskyi]TXD76344.1 altronate dehydratase [Algoriphagus ratkowskyi]
MHKNRLLKIDNADNVLVALVDLDPGIISYEELSINLPKAVKQKHKFLTTDLKKGEIIIRYGVPVGKANWDLKAGEIINIENITHFADEETIHEAADTWQVPNVAHWQDRTFLEYHRQDGKIGTANYWLFVPLVFCENSNLKVIEEALSKGLGYYKPNKYEEYVRTKISSDSTFKSLASEKKVFENIEGIKFLYHHGGCGVTRFDRSGCGRLLLRK